MTKYILSFDPSEGPFENHDASTAIFQNGSLIFAVIEEDLIREKRANTFPFQSIRACFGFSNIKLANVDEIVIPRIQEFRLKTVLHLLKRELRTNEALVGARSNI